ncbi:MAG TPA: 3-oxoadipate enol-lactonase [Burkholderiales bacterium]|jgi:3-oxoadipate enol-lactonase|nr:3-oxoadipate enol-lactonase [Burkholderiales bacterium]
MKAKVNGIEIYYELHGKEDAPWLVLSHSLACSVRMWDPQIEAFKASHRILAYDMRGHGRTSAPAGAYTLDMLADDVLGLVASLAIKSAIYCGLSIGGMIGQTLAIRGAAPFERMVLADTTHAQPPEALKQWEDRIRIAETKGMAALVESTLERWFTPPFRTSAAARKIAEQIAATPVAGYVGCGRAIMALNTTAKLKSIKLPVLAITGEQDLAAPGTRYIGENVPEAKLVVIPNASHIANIEQPEAFNRALREFLSSPASARA